MFHHCSHGTVLKTREANRRAGRLISALLLFKRFEDYQREHMIHHSPNKLLTEEDEFADFVMGMCGLEPGVPKAELWRRVIINSSLPVFHLRFLQRRMRASMFTGDRLARLDAPRRLDRRLRAGRRRRRAAAFLVAWVLPVTVLLQVATIFRILCEHRFPEPQLICMRDRELRLPRDRRRLPRAAPRRTCYATTLEGALRGPPGGRRC